MVAMAVAGNLSLSEIIQARDFALAEAARPAFGDFGLWFTVILAIIATVSGVIASAFAVSRMLAMLTDPATIAEGVDQCTSDLKDPKKAAVWACQQKATSFPGIQACED